MALYLSDLGYDLIVVGRNEFELRDIQKIVKTKVEVVKMDLSDRVNCWKLHEMYKKEPIEVLVNNAGFGVHGYVTETSLEKDLDLIDLNITAVHILTKLFLADMKKKNLGYILNVASIAGFMPGPFMATYHATKGYLLLLGEAISYELRKTKVKLLTLCPGPFNSEFVSKAHNDYTFKKIKPIEASEVAKYGYKKSLQGKSVAIVGFKNKLTVFATRLAPRSFVTKTSAKTMKKDA
jgi:short-subunit dehydrogenase